MCLFVAMNHSVRLCEPWVCDVLMLFAQEFNLSHYLLVHMPYLCELLQCLHALNIYLFAFLEQGLDLINGIMLFYCNIFKFI